MPPITLATALLISTGVSVAGTIAGGIGARREGELTAFNVETDKKLNQAQAAQAAQARREEYDLATASNIAAFSAAGRDIGQDRSVEAFLRKQEEIVGRDIGRMQTQTRQEDLRSMQIAAGERRKGRQALVASLFDAAATGARGYSAYLKAK